MEDVLEVLNQQDEEDAAAILAQEEERQMQEMLRKKVGVLTYDGYMEKKSPAHNLWQVRRSFRASSVFVISWLKLCLGFIGLLF